MRLFFSLRKGGKKMRKRITVINENESGRNINFKDNYTGKMMTLNQFVKKLKIVIMKIII